MHPNKVKLYNNSKFGYLNTHEETTTFTHMLHNIEDTYRIQALKKPPWKV